MQICSFHIQYVPNLMFYGLKVCSCKPKIQLNNKIGKYSYKLSYSYPKDSILIHFCDFCSKCETSLKLLNSTCTVTYLLQLNYFIMQSIIVFLSGSGILMFCWINKMYLLSFLDTNLCSFLTLVLHVHIFADTWTFRIVKIISFCTTLRKKLCMILSTLCLNWNTLIFLEQILQRTVKPF